MKKILLLAILSLPLVAQAPKPYLSQVEQLQRELLISKQQNLALQQQQLNRDIADFAKAVEASHPGFRLNEQGQLEEIPKKIEAPK